MSITNGNIHIFDEHHLNGNALENVRIRVKETSKARWQRFLHGGKWQVCCKLSLHDSPLADTAIEPELCEWHSQWGFLYIGLLMKQVH